MTYNVRCDFDAPPNSWNERRKLISEMLLRESPDIIGTQECLNYQVQDMASILPEYDWIGLGREGGSYGEYMAIFFKKDRFTALEYDHFWLSDTPATIGSSSWGNDCTRMATWVKFQDRQTGATFYHLNTHLDHISEEARVKGAELIIKKTDEFDADSPHIITGDFNTGTASDAHKIFLDKGNFIDAWDVAAETLNEELGTFNAFEDPSGGEDRIDWILIKGDVKTGLIKTIDDQTNGLFPSDHFPVVADIQI